MENPSPNQALLTPLIDAVMASQRQPVLIFIDDVRQPVDRGIEVAAFTHDYTVKTLDQFDFILKHLDLAHIHLFISFDYHVGYDNRVIVLGVEFIRRFIKFAQQHDFIEYTALFHSGQAEKVQKLITYYQQICAPVAKERAYILAVPTSKTTSASLY